MLGRGGRKGAVRNKVIRERERCERKRTVRSWVIRERGRCERVRGNFFSRELLGIDFSITDVRC